MVKFFGKVVSADAWVCSHDRISDFYASSWQRGESPLPMAVVRGLLTALSVAVLAWSIYESPTLYWLIFLTNWGLLLLVAMNVSGFVVSLAATRNRLVDAGELPWYVSWYWLLYNLAVTLAFVITILYWVLVYDPAKETEPRLFWLDVATHVLNSALAGAELLAARTPTRLVHVYQPLALGLWYAVFTAVYYLAGGTDSNGHAFIYEVLDWRSPARAGAVVGAAAGGLLAVWGAACGAARGRDALSSTLLRTAKHTLHTDANIV